MLIAEPQKIDNNDAIKMTLYSSVENKFIQPPPSKFAKRIPKNFYTNFKAQLLRASLESADIKSKETFHCEGFDC